MTYSIALLCLNKYLFNYSNLSFIFLNALDITEGCVSGIMKK